MAIGNIYQVRVNQLFQDEEMVNVFHYKQFSGSSGSAEDLYGRFADVVWDIARESQSPRCVTHRFEIINGMNNADFSIHDVTSGGAYGTGGDTSPQICAGYRSPSAGPGTQYGYKRVGGLTLTMLAVDNSGQFDGDYAEAYMSPLAILLGDRLTGTGATYDPCTVRGAFKLGTTPVLGRTLLGDWSISLFPLTQRTRTKYAWVAPTVP